MITVRIPDDLRDRIDAVRGKMKREPWIRRELDTAVNAAEVLHDICDMAVGETIPAASHDDTGAPNDGM